jgi:hypothetical protein
MTSTRNFGFKYARVIPTIWSNLDISSGNDFLRSFIKLIVCDA